MILLTLAARHGRALLVLGLLAGILLPGLAALIRPFLQELVALLLLLAAIRTRPAAATGLRALYLPTLVLVLAFQLLLPLAAIGVFRATGIADSAAALAIVLVLAASAISGGPHLVVMTGGDPAPALRLLILGTALLPLTTLPVFALLPGLGSGQEILLASARLLGVIAAAIVLAIALRRTLLKAPTRAQVAALDGLSALTMAIVVIGLMTAVGPSLRDRPWELGLWLALAFAVNFGLQVATAMTLDRISDPQALPARSIVAGNRNIALFLIALPPDVSDRILMFIGCYQVPMYLTPLLMSRFYRRWSPETWAP